LAACQRGGDIRKLRRRDPFEGEPVSGQYDWSYRERDARLWADYYGIRFREPPSHHFDFRLLARAATAAERLGRAADYGWRICAAVYGTDIWPIDETVCIALGQKIGVGYLLMDRKPILIDEMPGPGFEACDLLDIEGRRFIHIKKSSRQSSVLSHFFKRGRHAAQALRKYEPFKFKMIETVRHHFGAEKADALTAALDDRRGKRWTVEFQIADFPRPNGKHNIPFFSKLSLQDGTRDIRATQFDIRVRFIKLTRIKQAV
jgi:hypothetical protein